MRKTAKFIITFILAINTLIMPISAVSYTSSTFTELRADWNVFGYVQVRGADWIASGPYFYYPKTAKLRITVAAKYLSATATSSNEDDTRKISDSFSAIVQSTKPRITMHEDSISLYRRNTTLTPYSVTINE